MSSFGQRTRTRLNVTRPQARPDTQTRVRKRRFSDVDDGPGDEAGWPTKRNRRIAPLTSAERIELNAKSNAATLGKIYKTYYADDGTRINAGDALERQLEDVYRLMGSGTGDYTRATISSADFDRFLRTPRDLVQISGQKLDAHNDQEHKKIKKWEQDMRAWRRTTGPRPRPPRKPDVNLWTFGGTFDRGDYFHVENTSRYAAKFESSKEREENLSGRARRIVVNVKTQPGALKIADRLVGLYRDPSISPYLDEFKVYLTRSPRDTAKHDKMVIYYRFDDSAGDDDDRIGGAIVDTVAESLDPSEFSNEFAPFYARIDHGIAWGEEPKYYGVEGESFTTSREMILMKLIRDTANIDKPDTFVDLVTKALQDGRVDPDRPHRHLPITTA